MFYGLEFLMTDGPIYVSVLVLWMQMELILKVIQMNNMLPDSINSMQ